MNATHPDPATQLYTASRPPADVLVRQAHVVDPRTGIDEAHDVLIRDGEIAELGAPDTLPGLEDAETIEAGGRHLFPG
ncbi:MAG TPA: hypothetical protein VMA96_04475, partial [Solirubrobacteraceae bacterium]|nr:hypothetical protein [Solirubrobacteraceae bacterium]